MNRKQYIHENVVHNFMKDEDGNLINTIQNYADFAAAGIEFIPVVGTIAGNVADLVSAGVDVAQGEYDDAAIRALQSVPGLGQAALLTKFGSKGVGKLLGTGLTTKKAKVATQFGPSVGVGVYDAGKDAYDEFKSAMNQKQDEMDQGQGEQQKQSITPQQMAQLLSRKRNTGLVTPGTLQKFRESLEYTSQDITRCIIEANVKTKLVDLGTGKLTPVRYRPKGKGKPKGKDKDDKITVKPEKTGTEKVLTALGLGGPALGIGAAFGIPMLLGSGSFGFGTSETTPQGQGRAAGSGPEPGAGSLGSGASSIIDRLAMMYGYIPGFNPASADLGALGRRVGAVKA